MEETRISPAKILLGVIAAILGLGLGYAGLSLLLPKEAPAAPSSPAPSYLYTLRTTPPGASVAVDGQVLGKAPVVLSFSPRPGKEEYTLTLTHPGYQTHEIRLKPDQDGEQTISLVPATSGQ